MLLKRGTPATRRPGAARCSRLPVPVQAFLPRFRALQPERRVTKASCNPPTTPAVGQAPAAAKEPRQVDKQPALEAIIARATAAQAAYSRFTQDQVDKIFKEVRCSKPGTACIHFPCPDQPTPDGPARSCFAWARCLSQLAGGAGSQCGTHPPGQVGGYTCSLSYSAIPLLATHAPSRSAAPTQRPTPPPLCCQPPSIPLILLRLAVEETCMGLLEDKVLKNHFASGSSSAAQRAARQYPAGRLAAFCSTLLLFSAIY